MPLLWLIVWFTLLSDLAFATTFNPPTCNTADVQSAHTSAAVSGDTIQCPNGNFTWSGLNITKAVTIQGNGGATAVTCNEGDTAVPTPSLGTGTTNIALSGVNTFTKSASGVMRLKNIAFTASGGGNANQPMRIVGSWKGAHPVIFQSVSFNVAGSGLFRVTVPGGWIFSTMLFWAQYDDSIIQVKDPADAEGSWTNADTQGMRDTASTLSGTLAGTSGELNGYVEDSTFCGGTTQGIDCDDGCRFVFRHNNTKYFRWNSHGFGTSAVGNRHWELYSNNFGNPCSAIGGTTACGTGSVNSVLANLQNYIITRGGSGVIYDNTMDNNQNSTWGAGKEEALLGQDSNHTSGFACTPDPPGTYPLTHQLGSGYNGTSQFVDPIYLWNDTVRNNGLSSPVFDLGVGWFYTCSPPISNFVASLREYFNNSGTTTPKPSYTAFTYPHPLVSGGDMTPPATPTGLRIVP